jgi:hypothetical protein
MKRIILAAIAIIPLAALAACGDDDGGTDNGGTETPAASFNLPLPGGGPFEIEPAEFTTVIDNEFWPMEPGTRWTYKELDSEGAELDVIVTVTSATREIANGVTARVVRDSVYEDGELIEDTFDWYAQDAAGNIWYLGEDTAEFEGGEVTTTGGSWEAGVDGALPGIAIPAGPQVGMAYRQEYYEGEAEDNGEVLAVDATAEVPAGSYDSCLQTADTSALEPDVLEHKYYASGVGPVLAVHVDGGDREELISVETVDAAAAEAAGTTPLGEEYD